MPIIFSEVDFSFFVPAAVGMVLMAFMTAVVFALIHFFLYRTRTTSLDVSRLKIAEDALRASEARRCRASPGLVGFREFGRLGMLDSVGRFTGLLALLVLASGHYRRVAQRSACAGTPTPRPGRSFAI